MVENFNGSRQDFYSEILVKPLVMTEDIEDVF